jgi:hypothetical protein
MIAAACDREERYPKGGTLFEAGSNTSGRRGRLQLGEDRPQPLHAWRERDRIGGNHLMQQCDQDGFVGVGWWGASADSTPPARSAEPRIGSRVSRNVHGGNGGLLV